MGDQKVTNALTRGVENIYPNFDTVKKALSEKKLRIYHGIDPTGKSLHLGHMVQMLKLQQLQELGHHIIVLIGDFTAQIGDPSDKMAARKPLTHKQVMENAKDYKKQIFRFLDRKKTDFKYNSKWLSKLSFRDTISLTSHFTAQQTLARDMFKRRMKEGKDLFLSEFMYPFMQAYDSVAMDVDMEIGGSDQMFNMLAGRTLMKKMKNKEKFVLTTKLLVDANGKKMGKTEGNMVSLSDSPEEMFGKIMSWPDDFIVNGFELLTLKSMEDISEVKEKMRQGQNPKNFKIQLAAEVVALNYDLKKAEQAKDYFAAVFSKKEKPSEIEEKKVSSSDIIEVLVETGLASSKGEARRLIKQKGVKVDDSIANDTTKVLHGSIIQKGKRHFVKII